MINTYTCTPNQTSSETVFADLKTFLKISGLGVKLKQIILIVSPPIITL